MSPCGSARSRLLHRAKAWQAGGVTSEQSPSARTRRRWRQYLADERAEAAVYRSLAARRSGEERQILLAIADAEQRHEQHWRELLGEDGRKPTSPSLGQRLLVMLAGRFGSVFTLALMQRTEHASPYAGDDDATEQMAADEVIHAEVVRALAVRGRERLSGTFRAAIFGANDGLVSNLALILGIGATGVSTSVVLAAGLAGLLAGALSMAAGEYVSVRSQGELLAASVPDPQAARALPHLDLDANELTLVYRARGYDEAEASRLSEAAFAGTSEPFTAEGGVQTHAALGTAWGAAGASFCFFATGAVIPVLPYLLGASGAAAVVLATGLVGLALVATGSTVGVLSGAAPGWRALRQLAIGYGAAAVTYVLGRLLGGS